MTARRSRSPYHSGVSTEFHHGERAHPLQDSPRPSDVRHLRACLGAFATGVTIVTTRLRDGGYAGLTANSFNALSLEPPLVLWSLGLKSRNLDAFLSAERFAISVLAASQYDLAMRFSRTGVDRFGGIGTTPGIGGVPLIDGAIAWFECVTRAQHHHGDHVLFIGEVVRCARVPGSALVFDQGEFRATHPAPAPPLA